MANPFPLQRDFLGMRQDEARDRLPGGAVWNMVDMVPWQANTPLRMRGPWVDNGGLAVASSKVVGITYAPFTGGQARMIVCTNKASVGFPEGTLYYADTNVTSWTAKDCPPATTPLYYRSGAKEIIVIPPSDGDYTMKKMVVAGTITDLNASGFGSAAPHARLATIWLNRIVASKIVNNEQRVQFSNAGMDASGNVLWDFLDSNSVAQPSYVDSSAPVTGLHVLGSSLLVFHYDFTERILGTVPPVNTNFDMTLKTLFEDCGCIDTRTITAWNDTVVWADEQGIWQTDGATKVDLTKAAGMKKYYRNLVYNVGDTGDYWAGLVEGMILFGVSKTSASLDSFLIDPDRRAMVRLSNMPFTCLARSTRSGGSEDASYAGRADKIGIARLNKIVTGEGAQAGKDSNSTAIAPVIETGFFTVAMGRILRHYFPAGTSARLKELFIGYDLDTSNSGEGSTVLNVYYSTENKASPSYTLAGTLAASSGAYRFRKLAVRKRANGLALKLTLSGEATDFSLRTIELLSELSEGSRTI